MQDGQDSRRHERAVLLAAPAPGWLPISSGLQSRPRGDVRLFGLGGLVSETGLLLQDRGVDLGYGGHPVVRGLDGEYRRGERWTLVGPNGAGKSTFLKSLLDHELVLAGERHLAVPSTRVAWMPQQSRWSWSVPCSVREFLEAGLLLGRSPSAGLTTADLSEVDRVLEQIGLRGRAGQQLATLSGGQAQKLLFARALLMRAEVLLLDEPFSAVDSESRDTLVALLDESLPHTLQILVLHDRDDLHRVAGRVIEIREGRAHVVGPR